VGSIAHAHGRAAAAVARASGVAGVGIDCEPAMPDARSAPLRDRILTAHDEALIRAAGSGAESWSQGEQVTFVFSAKEAIYKCLRPLGGRYFGFEAAALVALDAGRGDFEFELLEAVGEELGAGWRGQGRFARQGGWIFTGVVLRR
jgi:enterobactin synthetase component D